MSKQNKKAQSKIEFVSISIKITGRDSNWPNPTIIIKDRLTGIIEEFPVQKESR